MVHPRFVSIMLVILMIPNLGQAADPITSTETAHLTCPSSPNCVSSFEQGSRRILPLSFPGKDTATIREILRAWIQQNPNAHITYLGDDLIKAEFKSRVFGFIDDLTLLIQPDSLVDVRSASRTGYYDFGVNRDRVEKLRKALQDQ